LALTVDGDVTLNGGTAAGSGPALAGGPIYGGQRTDLFMTVHGDVTLNPGAVAGAGPRIGSPSVNVAGGEIVLNVDGRLALNSAGPGTGATIRTMDDVALRAREISQGADAVIQANTLAIESQQGASLVGANTVSAFNALNTGFGDVAFNNGSALLTLPAVQNLNGALTLQQTGDVLITGLVRSGPQTIGATGGLTVRGDSTGSGQLFANGGQTIDAKFVEVNAAGGWAIVSNSGGEQRISTTGANTDGEGLAVRNTAGGFAAIENTSGQQIVDVRNADRVVLDSANGVARIFATDSVQTVSVTGTGGNALVLGSPGSIAQSIIGGGIVQTVVAGQPGEEGSITIYGTSSGGPANNFIVSAPVAGGTQTVSTSGTLTVLGGSAASGSGAGVFANGDGGTQTINAQDIVVQGGMEGTGNGALVSANNGTQHVNAGSILLMGGSAGTFNNALLRTVQGQQTIVADQVQVLAGSGGTTNAAVVTAPTQSITVSGDLTISGGGSLSTPTTGGGARIGGAATTPTNLALTVGGNVLLNGGTVAGSGSAIGNSAAGGQSTQITMNVGGNVTLNPGAVADAGTRIGSPATNTAGGEIIVNAGGTIALNSAGPGNAGSIRTNDGMQLTANQIVQGPDSQIWANTLSLTTSQGAGLVGDNAVNTLNAANSTGGSVDFNNASPLLVIAGIDQVSDGALTVSQTGDLRIAGDVQSGAQAISATGHMTIAAGDGPGVTVHASGPQTFNVGGSFSLLGGTALDGYAQTLASGPVQITTGGDLTVQGGSGLLAYALLYGSDSLRLTVGDELHVDGGSGLFAFARVQTDFWEKIFLSFPNASSGGYFVDGREGATHRGLDGFFNGFLPARRGRGLIVSYGQ
jgi:hypothetical protein